MRHRISSFQGYSCVNERSGAEQSGSGVPPLLTPKWMLARRMGVVWTIMVS